MAGKKTKRQLEEGAEGQSAQTAQINADPIAFLERLVQEAPEVIVALAERELADRARGDGVDAVAAFGEYVFGLKPARHHREWIEAELTEKRVVIVSPPTSAKTTWAFIFMAWWIGKHPRHATAFFSGAEDAALDMAEAVVSTIENNPRFADVFPNVKPDLKRGWSNKGWWVIDKSMPEGEWYRKTSKRKDPTLNYAGVGSKRANTIKVNRLIADDLHGHSSKESDTICGDTVAFVKDTLINRLKPNGWFSMNQTRWNVKDSVAYFEGLKRADGTPMYKVFTIPAIDKDGNSYWPEEWPIERLEEKKIETGSEWDLVWMADAQAALNSILKKEALHLFPVVNVLHTWTHYGGVDFAQKLQELTKAQEKVHSRFAYAMLGYSNVGLVLVDGYVDLIYMGEAENQFYAMSDLYHPVRVGIEVNAQNRGYYNNLVRRKIEQGYGWLNLMPINTTRNMDYRMQEMEPDFRLGTIQVSDGAKPFLQEFVNQWSRFGKKGALNDVLSAVHLARGAAYNLLLTETPEQRKARTERMNKDSIGGAFRQIENYYGVGVKA